MHDFFDVDGVKKTKGSLKRGALRRGCRFQAAYAAKSCKSARSACKPAWLFITPSKKSSTTRTRGASRVRCRYKLRAILALLRPKRLGRFRLPP